MGGGGFIILIATFLAACGIYLLWAVSQNGRGYRALYLVGGWGLLLGSLIGWSFTSGADKGVALGLICIVLLALIAMALVVVRTPERKVRPGSGRIAEPMQVGFLGYGRRVLVGILMGPVALLSALALCAATFLGLRAIGVEHTLNLTVVSIAFPLVWGGLSIIGGADTKLWRKSLVIIGAGIAPLAYITLSA
ncbi:MAG: hypothetical protein AAGB16_04010 [Pseudomonadota bacterium]